MNPLIERSLKGKYSILNEISDREAMGLSDDFTNLTADYEPDLFNTLRRLDVSQLVEICESRNENLQTRFVAGQLLALVGDPRIKILDPQMIPLSGLFEIGTPFEEIEETFLKYEDTGICKEWLFKECPLHERRLPTFQIGKYPVTNLEWREYLRHNPKGEIPSSWRFGRFPHHRANHPVYSIEVESAESYCQWLSRETGRDFRLPSEFEWEAAASGRKRQEFPWGNDYQKDSANTMEEMIASSTPIGMFPKGISWCGAMDLGGNVEEYTSSDYSSYSLEFEIVDDLSLRGAYKVARGGGYARHRDLARCARRHGRFPRDIYVMGFRLAEDLSRAKPV